MSSLLGDQNKSICESKFHSLQNKISIYAKYTGYIGGLNETIQL